MTTASSYYITGTDTGVGKTRVSVAMLHALRSRGLRAVGMKPVASGCDWTAEGWRNDDALALQLASTPMPPYAIVNPVALPEASAPQISARRAGFAVQLEPIQQAFAHLANMSDAVIVEGVGGWLAPLADGIEQSHLARGFGLPVIIVVGLRLGCLNHARLTERAVLADGVWLAGYVINPIDPELEHAGDYIALLQAELTAPCLGVLPWQAQPDVAAMTACLRLP